MWPYGSENFKTTPSTVLNILQPNLLLQNPDGGPHKILIFFLEFWNFEFVKSY